MEPRPEETHLRASARSRFGAVALSAKKSGGQTIQVSARQVRGPASLKRTYKVTGKVVPKYVRVQDVAGNWSSWHRIAVPKAKKAKKAKKKSVHRKH